MVLTRAGTKSARAGVSRISGVAPLSRGLWRSWSKIFRRIIPDNLRGPGGRKAAADRRKERYDSEDQERETIVETKRRGGWTFLENPLQRSDVRIVFEDASIVGHDGVELGGSGLAGDARHEHGATRRTDVVVAELTGPRGGVVGPISANPNETVGGAVLKDNKSYLARWNHAASRHRSRCRHRGRFVEIVVDAVAMFTHCSGRDMPEAVAGAKLP